MIKQSELVPVAEGAGQSADLHLLTDAELDDVNGGAAFLFLAGVAAGIWLSAGIVAVAREYSGGRGNVDFNEHISRMPIIL